MKILFLLLLFCHASTAVKHSLKYFVAAFSGVSDLPEFMGGAVFDDILLPYCDSNTRDTEAKLDWVKKILENDLQQLLYYTHECFEYLPTVFKPRITFFMQHFNQSEGVHVLQRMSGCEWDEETGEINGFSQYGYDGEDFMAFGLKTSTWIALKPKAVTIKQRWDADKPRAKDSEIFLTQICPVWLKMYSDSGIISLQRTELPSVSLLQKTPSSPVSCHATGFYPDRATMFWRKDGEELHEDVDRGEILPNNDGSFQMSVDLKPASEDWEKYECVFQLAGVKNDIVTKLDKAKIRNNKEKPSDVTIPIIAIVVVLAVIIAAAAGFIIYKKRTAKCPQSSENSSELSQKLNPGP